MWSQLVWVLYLAKSEVEFLLYVQLQFPFCVFCHLKPGVPLNSRQVLKTVMLSTLKLETLKFSETLKLTHKTEKKGLHCPIAMSMCPSSQLQWPQRLSQ